MIWESSRIIRARLPILRISALARIIVSVLKKNGEDGEGCHETAQEPRRQSSIGEKVLRKAVGASDEVELSLSLEKSAKDGRETVFDPRLVEVEDYAQSQ